MSIFTDDFERADGGLGNNWTYTGAAPSIASGQAVIPDTCYAVQTSYYGSGRQEVVMTVDFQEAADLAASVILKYGAGYGDGYHFRVTGTLSSPVWHIVKQVNYTSSPDWYVGGPSISTGTHVVRCVYEGGWLGLYYDGALIVSATDNTHDSRTPLCLYGNGNTYHLEDVTIAVDESVTFSVSPAPIGNFGSPVTVTFTGVGTAWTSGTPGSPTFSVNHGTLTDQEVTSATEATATYDPGAFLGIARFLDPSTGAYDDVEVSSDPILIPPGDVSPFNEDFVDLANRTGTAYADSKLLTEDTVIIPFDYPDPDLTLVQLLGEMWTGMFASGALSHGGVSVYSQLGQILMVLNGGYELTGPFQEPEMQPVALTLKAVREQFYDPVEEVYVSTPDLLTAIEAVEGGDLAPVRADIGIDGQSTWTSILEVLLAMWGTTPPTIADLGTMISDIATIAGYTLGDVMDAIAAIPGVDLTPVTDKLALIQPSTSYSLSTLDADIANLDGDVAAVKGVVDAIKVLVEALPGASDLPTVPPVWPGVANATLGTPQALADGLTLTGPMHGIIVNITGNPPSAGKYMFGTETSWTHVGAVAFVNDRGDYERPEALGLEDHVVTPRTMPAASSAVLRINSGFTGTARTWIKTA